MKTIETDVLVVGGGAAATRAAIEADRCNARVVIADKGRIGKSGTTATAGGRATDFEGCRGENDRWKKMPVKYKHIPESEIEKRFKRLLETGCWLADQDLLWTSCTEAPEAFQEMSRWSARKHDSFSDACMNEIQRSAGITVIEHAIITRLLTQGGRIVGATGLNIRTGEFILIRVKAVILGTGGYSELYKPSEGVPLDIRTGQTGDGQSLSYHAGVELCNMEFTEQQIVPDTPKWNRWHRHLLPAEASFRMAMMNGPYFDKEGNVVIFPEEILGLPNGCAHHFQQYSPQLDMLVYTRGLEHGGIYLDQKALIKDPVAIMSKLSDADKVLKIDPLQVPRVKVANGCIIGQGGPKITVKGETSVPGLYGAGEGAGSGNLYGAYRTGGLMDSTLVFGKRAGRFAAEYAKTVQQGDADTVEVAAERARIFGFLEPKPNPVSPTKIKDKIWETTRKHLFLVRDEQGMNEAIQEIEELRAKELPRIQAADIRRLNWEWVDAIEVPFMLDCAEMIARSALFRTESRGCHYRKDFPEMDNRDWLCHTLLKKEKGKMKLAKGKVVMTKLKPPPVLMKRNIFLAPYHWEEWESVPV
ncbi:MAG: FAD-binding protein [Syntrophaceae bacterium]|nr:FAD-binding protein [Syntrophaceae bacterium]